VPQPAKLPEAASLEPGVKILRGAWGELECRRIAIERPDEFIMVDQPIQASNRWFFPELSEAELPKLFQQPDLTAEQQTVLLDRRRWEVLTNGIYVTPGTSTILALSGEARQRLYALLGHSAANPYHYMGFRFKLGAVEEWFDRSQLSPRTVNLIRRLVYRRGNTACFSDILEVLSQIPSAEERRRLVKTLSRQSTLLVKLRIRDGQNVENLEGYWSRLGRAKDVRPLLESLARAPGGATLDIAHLLPPFARRRLYTYPFPSEKPSQLQPDCFWTSMNFFAEDPDDRFYDREELRRTVDAEYYPIQGPPTFGDVVYLINAQGIPIHAAVYVAGNIVFSKNGVGFNHPWILVDLDELVDLYGAGDDVRVLMYRYRRS